MFDKYLAKLFLCVLCISSFSSRADFLYDGPVEFPDENLSPRMEDFSRYAAAEGLFEDETGFSDRFRASHVSQRPHRPQRQWSGAAQPAKVRLGLQYALQYLSGKNSNLTVARSGVRLRNGQLLDTVKALLDWRGDYTPAALRNNFYLMDLGHANTQKSKFTGYYTPIISAKLSPDNEYRYPIYRSPITTPYRLTRAQIAAGALADKGLEIAWTNDPLGLFYVHIQGSGILQLPNGERKSLKFDGSNEKPFKSIASYMQRKGLLNGNPGRSEIKRWLDRHPHMMQEILNYNPRYIYFTLDKDYVRTASGVPVVPGHTVAVDTDYIPFGAVILAEVPIVSSANRIVGKEWRILFPQDRGKVITGPARMDIYTGVGESARKMANNLTGYGKTYLLLNRNPYGNRLAAN